MSWIREMDRRYDGPRCPSGPWEGVFRYPQLPREHEMVLSLAFDRTCIDGGGYDDYGEFEILGRYLPWSGSCVFTKRYTTAHEVYYSGAFDGRKIVGEWQLAGIQPGAFMLWPVPRPRRQS